MQQLFLTRGLASFAFTCAKTLYGISFERSYVIQLSNQLQDIGSFETKDGYFTATFSKSQLDKLYPLNKVLSTYLAVRELRETLVSTLESQPEFEGLKVNLIVRE